MTGVERVYIETSIVSYLTARPTDELLAAAWQNATCQWWDRSRRSHELVTSSLVFEEAGRGDPDAVKRRLGALKGIPNLRLYDEITRLTESGKIFRNFVGRKWLTAWQLAQRHGSWELAVGDGGRRDGNGVAVLISVSSVAKSRGRRPGARLVPSAGSMVESRLGSVYQVITSLRPVRPIVKFEIIREFPLISPGSMITSFVDKPVVDGATGGIRSGRSNLK